MKPKTNTNTKEGQEKCTNVTEINMCCLFGQKHQTKRPVTLVLVLLTSEPSVNSVNPRLCSIYLIRFCLNV
jgi:hypothetical protein